MPGKDPWADSDESPELDFRALVTWTGFAFRAVRRHWLAAIVAVGACIGLGAAAVVLLPRAYLAEARILTQPSNIIPSLVASQRRVSPHDDQPTRGVPELVSSRPFLARIIERTNTHGQLLRPASPLGRLLARLFGGGSAAPMPEEQREVLVKLLGKRIEATTARDVINIEVEWSDPATTLLLAGEVVRLLLEDRQANEMAQIRETMSILKSSLDTSEKRLSATADRLEEVLQAKLPVVRRRLGQSSRAASRVMSIRRPAPVASLMADMDEATEQVRDKLQERQRELHRVSSNYDTEVRRARQTLEQLSGMLGPNHPDLREAKRRVTELDKPPKVLASLAAEVELLQGQAEAMNAEEPDAARYRVMEMPVSEEVYAALNADPEVANLMAEVAKYSGRHDELFRLLENTLMEQRTAEAAFSYRYTVTEPPVLPTEAESPSIKLIWAASLLLGLSLAFATCILLDIASRRVVEGWQVEQFTGLRLLGEVSSGQLVRRRTSASGHGPR